MTSIRNTLNLTTPNKRRFATIDSSPVGGFDGATVDAEGYLWNALVYAGRIVRWAPLDNRRSTCPITPVRATA